MTVMELLQRAAPVMPVVTIDKLSHAVPLARALAAGGIDVIEITLRTDAAIPAIEAIRAALPDCIVGAGTVLNATHLDAVAAAGGQFTVSPGLTGTLAAAAAERAMPLLPGVVTAGEIQHALEYGLDCLKFFPASAAGGPGLLRNYAAPFPQIRFCPTGGISPDSAPDYLSLPNVTCVGGSWVTPSDVVAAEDWDEVTRRAKACAALAL